MLLSKTIRLFAPPLLAVLVVQAARAEEPAAVNRSLTLRASLAPTRFPVQIEQVVAAAAGRIPLGDASVRLAAPMTASSASPEFDVTAVAPSGDRGARLRVSCRRHEQCLSFYLLAEWPTASAAQTALSGAVSMSPGSRFAALHKDLSPTPPDPGGLTPPAPDPARSGRRPEAATGSADGAAAGASVVHAGGRATLMLDQGRLHIKLPVICLESGEPGRTIRVTAADHRQTYSAEVVDATLLKGTL